ncbi:thioredoxin family protein [Methanobrevibacter sp.]
MKKYIIPIIILALIALACASIVSSAESNQIVDGLNYTSDLNQAFDDAKTQNRTVMILFDQDSCYYCDLLKSDVLSDEDVQKELNEKFIIYVCDINRDPQLAADFQVFGTPTVIFLDGDANVVQKIEGYVSSDEFQDVLAEI